MKSNETTDKPQRYRVESPTPREAEVNISVEANQLFSIEESREFRRQYKLARKISPDAKVAVQATELVRKSGMTVQQAVSAVIDKAREQLRNVKLANQITFAKKKSGVSGYCRIISGGGGPGTGKRK